MDTDQNMNCKPSVCQLGIDEKVPKKMVDEETLVHEEDIADNSQELPANEPVCRSDCQWPAHLLHHHHHHQHEAAPKRVFRKIGHFGLGAWRVGKVPSDVILERI